MEVCKENNHNEACNIIRNVYGAKHSQIERETLVKSIKDGNVSLSDMVCDKDGQVGGVSLFQGLVTLPNGHLLMKEVLNTQMEKMETEEIKIKLGSGLLYRIGKDFCETKILEDLLKVRRQCKERGSTAEDAVNGVLTHPVMEAFIRQKWHMAKFLFFAHIRMWFVFTIAFSCYLRVEINTQLIRNEFYDKHNKWNENSASNLSALLREDQNCMRMDTNNGTDHKHTRELKIEEAQRYLNSSAVKICHPQNDTWLTQDSSRILFLSILVFSAMVCFFLLTKICRDQLPNLPPLKNWSSSPLLPFHLAKNCNKNCFQNFTNLLATTIVFIMMLICYHSDGQNIKLHPARPFLDFDDGFRFIEVVLLLLALYFVGDFFNEIVTQKQSWSNWTQLADPISSFQLVSSLSAIVALIRKCYLTSEENGGQGPATAAGAIGITLAYLCLILKHGRYNFTTIGNFATMFHIILKKLRSYLVVAFVLLFGFSFGFWVIKQHENKGNDARFKGFLTSIKACFVMFFGGFDEYDDVLLFDEEIEKDHHLTMAAFYILYLMMIIVTSLGMLNILLAAIISDYNKNKKEVHTQNLLFMAQYSVVLEQGLGRRIKELLVKKMKMKSFEKWARLDDGVDTYTYCTLDLCYEKEDKTKHIHPEEEFRNIIVNRD